MKYVQQSLGFIFRKSPEEVVQKHELNRLNEELKVVPMIDEFPRYARLERKIAKLTASISKLCLVFTLFFQVNGFWKNY